MPRPSLVARSARYTTFLKIFQAEKVWVEQAEVISLQAINACIDRVIVVLQGCIDKHGGDRFVEWEA